MTVLAINDKRNSWSWQLVVEREILLEEMWMFDKFYIVQSLNNPAIHFLATNKIEGKGFKRLEMLNRNDALRIIFQGTRKPFARHYLRNKLKRIYNCLKIF